MSIKSKKKPFKFTFGIFVRLGIFIVIIFFVLSYLSSSIENKKTSILGENTINTSLPINLDQIYNVLPSDSQNQINIFKSASTSAFIQEKIELLKIEAAGFPDKQIKEIQKQVVNNVYDNIINSIEKK